MLVDSHCHLTDERLLSEIDEVVERAKKAGAKRLMTAGTGVEDGRRVVELARKMEMVDGVIGIHPDFLNRKEKNRLKIGKEVEQLVDLLEREKKWVKGIGEIGLDFHYDKEKKTGEKQVWLLKTQMKLAREMDLPVVVHMREAEEEMKECLKVNRGLRGVFHCWGGSSEMLTLILEKNFYVSMAGNVTFKNAEGLREMLKMVPKERLLLETDSPYLSPEPMRGRSNEPKNVKILAKFVAEARGESLDSLIRQTGENYLCLFG